MATQPTGSGTEPVGLPSNPQNILDQPDEDYYMLSASSDDDEAVGEAGEAGEADQAGQAGEAGEADNDEAADDADGSSPDDIFDDLLDISVNQEEVHEEILAIGTPKVSLRGQYYVQYIPAWTDPRLAADSEKPYPYRRPALLPEDRRDLATEEPSVYAQ